MASTTTAEEMEVEEEESSNNNNSTEEEEEDEDDGAESGTAAAAAIGNSDGGDEQQQQEEDDDDGDDDNDSEADDNEDGEEDEGDQNQNATAANVAAPDPDATASEQDPDDDDNDDDDAMEVDGEDSQDSTEDKKPQALGVQQQPSVAAPSLPEPASTGSNTNRTGVHPKMRIKLRLPTAASNKANTAALSKLPTTSAAAGTSKEKEKDDDHDHDDTGSNNNQDNDGDGEVNATAVADDNDEVVDAVAVPEAKETVETTTATVADSAAATATTKNMLPLAATMKNSQQDKAGGGGGGSSSTIASGKDRPKLSSFFRKALPISTSRHHPKVSLTGGTSSTEVIAGAAGVGERTTASTAKSSLGRQRTRAAPTMMFNNKKQVKLPPIASPGLLMPSSGQGPRQAAAAAAALAAEIGVQKDGFVSAQQLFHTTMAHAGYTKEQRTTQPHRGSSVERTVADLFDTPIKLAAKPVELIERSLWDAKIPKEPHTNAPTTEDGAPPTNTSQDDAKEKMRLTDALLQSLEQSSRRRKRPRRSYSCTPFRAMVPVSLTISYPDGYIQRQRQFVKDVEMRETAIVKWQEAQEKLEMEREEQELRELQNPDLAINEEAANLVNPVTIAPIPEPPNPPQWDELVAPDAENETSQQDGRYYYHYLGDPNHSRSPEFQHPICIRKGQEKLVAHLDKNCFHISQGRYFALQSSHTADPNFCGANAPGIAGVTTGGGLATATTSTTTSTSGLSGGGMTMILSTSFHSAAAVPPNRDGQQQQESSNTGGGKEKSTDEKAIDNSKKGVKADGTVASDKHAKSKEPVGKDSKGASEKQKASAAGSGKPKSGKSKMKVPTKTAAYLRRKMESDETTSTAFRDRIIGAAVQASRKSKHLSHFKGPDGEIYPDVAKAFATYSRLKPCERCKSNKQGVSVSWRTGRLDVTILCDLSLSFCFSHLFRNQTYHCRLRRRHQEADFDGGKSFEKLKPYLTDEEPLQKKEAPTVRKAPTPDAAAAAAASTDASTKEFPTGKSAMEAPTVKETPSSGSGAAAAVVAPTADTGAMKEASEVKEGDAETEKNDDAMA